MDDDDSSERARSWSALASATACTGRCIEEKPATGGLCGQRIARALQDGEIRPPISPLAWVVDVCRWCTRCTK